MKKIDSQEEGEHQGLLRLEAQTLREVYLHLEELHVAYAAFLLERKKRGERLDARAQYVLNSLQVAKRFLRGADPAPNPERHAYEGADRDHPANDSLAIPMSDVLALTKKELEQAKEEFTSWRADREEAFLKDFGATEDEIIGITAQYARYHKPRLSIEVAPVVKNRSIVHVIRPGDEDAIVLCWLLTGRPPSRYDYLRDDSVDPVDGKASFAVRDRNMHANCVFDGTPDSEDALSRHPDRRLLPIRAHLPIIIDDMEWPRMRLVSRGPVLELQVRELGEDYVHIFDRSYSELFTGFLVSLRAKRLLDIDIEML